MPYDLTPLPPPDPRPIEQGNASPSTSALQREYEIDMRRPDDPFAVKITKGPIYHGRKKGYRLRDWPL